VLWLAACGRGGEGAEAERDTPPAADAPIPAPATEVDPAAITPALLARGDSIFHGRAASGICYSCHGLDAKGMASMGPDLTDDAWLHTDGSYAGILGVVRHGVPTPKKATVPMPPMGAQLTEEQLRAVAAYVYSLPAH
jgi:mono/diheme cytochrome c family protein